MTEDFDSMIAELTLRVEKALRLNVNDVSIPITSLIAGAQRSYRGGYKFEGCWQAANVQFAIEDLERVEAADDALFRKFRKEFRRTMVIANYYGLRQELRMAAALLAGGVKFFKSETPDFILASRPTIGIECTSTHLSEGTKQKDDVSYKISSSIAGKSNYLYSTDQVILAIDRTNVMFHDALSANKTLSNLEISDAVILPALEASPFQAVLMFTYAAVPAEYGNGVTLTSYYSRRDRPDISKEARTFLDLHYPMGNFSAVVRLAKYV